MDGLSPGGRLCIPKNELNPHEPLRSGGKAFRLGGRLSFYKHDLNPHEPLRSGGMAFRLGGRLCFDKHWGRNGDRKLGLSFVRRFSAAQSLTVIFGGWGESLPSGGIHIMIFSSGTSLKFRVLGCLGWAAVSVLINIGGETWTEN